MHLKYHAAYIIATSFKVTKIDILESTSKPRPESKIMHVGLYTEMN